jgi:nucleolar protein TMA23
VNGILPDPDPLLSIFAAAAINIKVSSQTPTPAGSGTATPVSILTPRKPLKSAEREFSQTKDASPAVSKPSQPQSSMNAFARGKQEMARRILYSKFLRGQVIVSEDLDKIPGASDQPPKILNAEAGSSFSIASIPDSRSSSAPIVEGTASSDSSAPLDAKKGESKEEKAQRRAEKAAKKQRSLDKKAAKQAKLDRKERRKSQLAEEGDSPAPEETIRKQKSSKSLGKERAKESGVTGQGVEGDDEKERKKRKRELRTTPAEDGAATVDDAGAKPKRKKKRKADEEV